MTVQYTNAVKTARAAVVATGLDSGAGDASGDIACFTAGLAILLATCPLSNPAIASNANGLLTFDTITNGTVAGSGNPSNLAVALFRNRANTEQFRANFGVSGSDINGPSIAVNDGDTIEFTNLTLDAG